MTAAAHPTPVGTSARAGDAEILNEDVVVYPNTGKDSDTAVRPTENGVETFTGIRSKAAAEEFSFKIDLDGPERIEQTDDGGIAIVDTDASPEAAFGGDKPADVVAGTEKADELKSANPAAAAVPDASPQAAEEAAAAVGAISEVEDPAKVERADSAGAVKEPVEPPPTGGPTGSEPTEVQGDKSATDALTEAQADAAEQLDELRDDAAAINSDADAAAEQTAKHNSQVVVATIKPTWAKDAEGRAVETSLSVSGDTVTMHVEHRGEDVAYPIVADPWVEVQRWYVGISHWQPVWRQETYLSHWAVGAAHVGWAHPGQCFNGWRCHNWGNGWHSISSVFTRFEHGWNWAPTYTFYSYPVYATRWVIARWEPVYAWMSYTDYEWQEWQDDDPGPPQNSPFNIRWENSGLAHAAQRPVSTAGHTYDNVHISKTPPPTLSAHATWFDTTGEAQRRKALANVEIWIEQHWNGHWREIAHAEADLPAQARPYVLPSSSRVTVRRKCVRYPGRTYTYRSKIDVDVKGAIDPPGKEYSDNVNSNCSALGRNP